MRIHIYGAGVIGSLYAALFAQAGFDTSIYARGKRLETLQTRGLLYAENQPEPVHRHQLGLCLFRQVHQVAALDALSVLCY